MSIRSAKVGEEFVYLGKRLGKVKVDKVEVKGSPKEWVDSVSKVRGKDDIERLLLTLASAEKENHPFKAGEKMGRKMFWRNALGYYRRKNESKN